MNRNASVVWKGTLREGTGTMTTESGVLSDTRYSFHTRFRQGIGTNPDELIAASLGGTTWVNQATGVFGSVSVYAINPTTAWIGGLEDLGRTTDSGATWTIERPSDTDWFCMTFLDADNGWAGGQDQTIDDVPGSIWKRSGSASAGIVKDTIVPGTGSLLKSGVWQAPPSRPGTEPDAKRQSPNE